MAERMSTLHQLAYAAGSPGYVSIDHLAGGMLLCFYLPPPGRGLDAQVPTETLMGPLTTFGIAMLVARTVDSAASHVLFAMAASLVFPVLPYVATVLLGRTEGFAFELSASLGVMIGLGYAVVPRLLTGLRPKRILLSSFGLYAVAASALGTLAPSSPGQPEDARNLFVAFTALGAMGLAIAGVSLLPNVLVGQLIDEDAERGGANRSALFLGVMRAFDKWAFGLSSAVIAFLFARYGNGVESPLGVRLVGPIAAGAAALAALVFTRFPERR